MITSLTENQIFVFGSNLRGMHAGGAAHQAFEKFGAVYGRGHGLQGQSYAIPTMDENMRPLSLGTIKYFLEEMEKLAALHPEKEFLLTPIGTGIAGHSLEEIKNILPQFSSNVVLIGDWEIQAIKEKR